MYVFGSVVLFILAFLILVVISVVSLMVESDSELLSSYECGFNSVTEVRKGFSYRFFLIAILFLIFDVEIVLLLPTPLCMLNNVSGGFLMLFLFVLLGGIMYEMKFGVLKWLE